MLNLTALSFGKASPSNLALPSPVLWAGLFLVGLCGLAPRVQADDLLITLIAPTDSVAPNADLAVGLLAANSGTNEVDFNPSRSLTGFLSQDGRTWKLTLNALPDSRKAIAPGTFANRRYSLKLPEGATGSLVLQIDQGLPHPLRAIIAVATPSFAPPAPAVAATTPPIPETRTVASTIHRSFVDRFAALDPIYFVYGPKMPGAKFQFSFKYRLLSFDGRTPESPDSSLQFGYTQRTLWDLNASSSPFYDTSYMPSLFYQYQTPARGGVKAEKGVAWLGFQTGYQHESNGLASAESRSVNNLYVRSGVLLGRSDGFHAIVEGRVFGYVAGLSDNPDLKNYRGYGDWQVILAKGEGVSLAYTGRAGKDGNHFTSQYDLNIPVSTHFLDFATYFLVQYFHGYGESLRSYNAYSNVLRAGISLVR